MTKKAFANARRIPMKIDGNVAGKIILKKRSMRFAPRDLAPFNLSISIDDAPEAVVIKVTNPTANAIRFTFANSPIPNHKINKETRAKAGINLKK